MFIGKHSAAYIATLHLIFAFNKFYNICSGEVYSTEHLRRFSNSQLVLYLCYKMLLERN